MNRRTTALTASVLAAVVVLLAGCTPGAPEPTKKPTASSTPTSTPTPTPTFPTQEPVPAPTDMASAIAGANRAYIGFKDVQFELFKNPDLGVQHVTGYVLEGTPAWTHLDDSIRLNVEQGNTFDGEPSSWTLNEAMSYAAPATNQKTGEAMEFGSVVLYGCIDNTKTVFSDPEIPKGSFPYRAELVYITAEQVWLVQNDEYLTGGEMPQC